MSNVVNDALQNAVHGAANKALLLARLRYAAGRLGTWGWAGVALLMVAAAVQWIGVADLESQRLAMEDQLRALRQQPAPTVTPEQLRAQRLAATVAALPDADSAWRTLAHLHQAAQAQHVQLATGDYRLQAAPAGTTGLRLQRYQLTFPARGDYLALRNWLALSLNNTPALALDELSFKRDDATAAQLESRVRMTLFMKAH